MDTQPDTAEVDRSRSSVGYVVALIGVAGFVIGCFLPFLGTGGQPARAASVSLYRQLTGFADDGAYRIGELLILFGGVTVVGLVAILGAARRSARSWTARALVFVAATWAAQWIGVLLVDNAMRSRSPLNSLEAGYWCIAASVVVVAVGAILANLRHGGAGASAA
jgi:hypothetical protein